jgi:hypothetical protein
VKVNKKNVFEKFANFSNGFTAATDAPNGFKRQQLQRFQSESREKCKKVFNESQMKSRRAPELSHVRLMQSLLRFNSAKVCELRGRLSMKFDKDCEKKQKIPRQTSKNLRAAFEKSSTENHANETENKYLAASLLPTLHLYEHASSS